jgi:phosphoribosyl 1,2-cyclic phosphodiesterase
MSKIFPLCSSSSGNSTYIGSSEGSILIDAGTSFKRICENLSLADVNPCEISAVAITHEHTDHIKGLKTFLNKTSAKLVASLKTAETLISGGFVPSKTEVVIIDETPLEIGGMLLSRFETSHDCDGSSGYTVILPDNKKIALCTDLGIVTDTVRQNILGSDLVLIESNHDVTMLKSGPYPPQLTVRILSDKGHLSNNMCANELKNLLQSGTKRFILGHLSQHNNTPLLAKSCAEAALIDLGAKMGSDYILNVAKPCNNGVTVI